ncbi:hypothetical protein PV327_002324 [Microctonus hyperodae]|uniref:PHD-type domain-containing protein n=2 Tax=Microctonus hyperodae TaxID=165561 RepID=A0AA39FFH6_MICHY|nr:hypothetical protein PV327_002324 [Microctonus hyperodae]
MRGKETMNTSLGLANEFGPTVTLIPPPKSDIDIKNIDCQLNITNNNKNLPDLSPTNNYSDSQHGVNCYKLDVGLYNGPPIWDHVPQLALPSTNAYWDYQINSLLTCNSNQLSGSLNRKYSNFHNNEIDSTNYHSTIQSNNYINSTSTAATTKLEKSIVNLAPTKDCSTRKIVNTENSLKNRIDEVKHQPEDLSVNRKIYDKSLPQDCNLKLFSNNNYKSLSSHSTKSKAKKVINNLSVPSSKHSNEYYNYLLSSTSSSSSSTSTPSQTKIKQKLDKYSPTIDPNNINNAANLNPTRNLDVDPFTFADERIYDQSTNLFALTSNFWEDFAMSGQYPGHSRPPVGTPPPQAVWNHLTMTQGAGLNIHPTALSGGALNSAGFYTHPSMARATHLTPQLAHTQAPPTWHTPTVPSKNVNTSNAPGNPLFSLQMLVDNRQNQNQYRGSPGSQSTLDLSATSEMAENYSRMTQDIPISLTARNVDKGSRNGNIISPPIPLNGETSLDSGISSSVPTPNSIGDPMSLSTKDLLTTPKITVKNFESNLKGVANLHDKIKEISGGIDSFTQKIINLPPSVTIERVLPDKKETEPVKFKDSLSVIAQGPRNILPVIVNLTSRTDKDVTDSPKREPSSERDRKFDEANVRSPKNLPKRGRKGVDSLLEKLEGGNKKLGSTENIGSVIVTPLEDAKDGSSVKSMSPDRQKSKSPTREDDVVSPAFSNDDSNDQTKQRRKRKLEKPVRLSKDSKTEVEDMELEMIEPRESRVCPIVPEEPSNNIIQPAVVVPSVVLPPPEQSRLEERIQDVKKEEETNKLITETNEHEKNEENEPVRRRRSSEGSSTNPTPTSQRARRKSSDDVTELSKSTSPKGVTNATSFNEVESELEKMFAGIVETDTEIKKEDSKVEVSLDASADTVKEEMNVKIEPETTGDQTTNLPDVTSTIGAKPTPKKGKKGRARGKKRKVSRASDNIFGPAGEEMPVKETKKRKASKSTKKSESAKKKKKTTKSDGLREQAYDSGSNASSIRSRGPVVHVEGPRDSPLSVQVVNAPREDEEEKSKEKRKSVGNGNAGRSKRLSHQNDLDYRGKVGKSGLFSSTLSSRYDAHTTDSSWVCVFCKQGPHSIIPGDPRRPHPNLAGPHIAAGTYTVPAGVLSDLFGPYLIGRERLEEGILSADEQEITIEQKKGGKNKRSLRYAGLADQFSAKMGKKKRNSIETNTAAMFSGMTLISGEEQRWEVWLHEQCAVWAAGVYLAGGRVTGLQEAVWDATKSICETCGLTGANIGCVKRGCKAVTHYPCALTKGWHLDSIQYIPKCNVHRVT